MTRLVLALALCLLVYPSAAHAQSASLPGCEAPPEVRKTIKDQLHGPAFERLPYPTQLERKQQILSRLMERYPRVVEPYTRWIGAAREDHLLQPELLAGLQKQYRDRAAAHPDDPFALYLAGRVLNGTDTPSSITALEQAQTLAPRFPWPSLELAAIYSSGKYADKTKFTAQLTRFWTACPTSEDQEARWMLVKVPELQKQVAGAVRASLAKETDPDRLKDNYEFLWGLEFRTTSPKEFPALRQQIAADVQRLESLHNPHADADWASLLLHGSQQAGASAEAVHARQDAILTRYPHSGSASSITWKRWKAAHPEPTDSKDTAAWQSYNAALRAEQLTWFDQFPDEHNPHDFYRLDIFRSDDSLTEPQGVELAEKAAQAANAYFPPGMRMWGASQPGSYLLDHKWAPDKALDYLRAAKQWQDRADAEYYAEDDHSEQDIKDHARSTAGMVRYFDGQILLAAVRSHRPDAIDAALKTAIEGPRAEDDKDESGYWWRRALLATLEDRKQDALGYYQLALRTRSKPPGYQQGKLKDDLSDEAHALWIERGGTEIAWAAWSQPAATTDSAKADDARWEKPTKTLPEFNLADLSGKTWTTKSLNGKVVLINLWATWCGPCNAELPQLQKLYDQAKSRPDVEILTFNIDEDLGLVEPFLKEKGYTFPVLPAYSYVVSLLDGFAIPQNWLLNPKGEWQWTQFGYGSDDAWVQDMLAKLDAMKSGT